VSHASGQFALLSAALADRYRVERPLGEGGMATVYLAQDLRHSREVALKVLKPELAEAVGAQRFLKEIQVTAKLQHPHILPLYDSGNAGGALFYVMPLVRGETLRERLTRDGQLSIGTIQYMSPEQAAGERDIDARSDIYSLGAVAYEMLVGEPPVTGATARAMIATLMTEMPASVRTRRSDVPASVDAAVQRALSKDPADRFATARDFGEALSVAMPFNSGNVDTRQLQTSLARRRGRMLTFAVLAGVAVAGGYALVRRGAAERAAPVAADAPVRSIAVLPLDNHSGDSTQDYFAEGMTDELTAAVATISAIRVTSRGSAMQFHGKARPSTPDIAKALNVDAILEGSVARSGDKVRITVELIDARADKHILARSFERNSNDVLALQADLASARRP